MQRAETYERAIRAAETQKDQRKQLQKKSSKDQKEISAIENPRSDSLSPRDSDIPLHPEHALVKIWVPWVQPERLTVVIWVVVVMLTPDSLVARKLESKAMLQVHQLLFGKLDLFTVGLLRRLEQLALVMVARPDS